jgi:signal transduction histidine kinase
LMVQIFAGKIRFIKAPIDFIELSQAVLGSVCQQISHSEQYRFNFHIDEQISLDSSKRFISGDGGYISMAIENLFINAIMYSPKGSAIEIGYQIIDTQSEHIRKNSSYESLIAEESSLWIEMSIRDHGIGIPANHMVEIFTPFHRVDDRLTSEVNGLGLGLTASKHIIELHGGKIWVESELQQGSIFHILFPMITP